MMMTMTMLLLSTPISALVALLLLSNDAGAFGIGSSPYRRAVAAKLAGSSGGMDAYDRQIANVSGTPDAATVDKVAAEMLDSHREQSNVAASAASTPVPPAVAVVSGDIDAAAAISALDASQTQTVADFAIAIPDLAPKPDQSFDESSGFAVSGKAVRLSASDAPGPANIAWLSDLCVDATASSLTIYNGPLTGVPHLISRCVVTGGDTLHFFLDFRPRSYGAYELRDASGNYPGPETLGRKAFEYSGARKDFESTFGTEDVAKFFAGISSTFEGAVQNDGDLSELEKLTRGPLAMDATMPLSAHNVNTILSARAKAASLWLEWALDSSHAHRPGAPINSQYVYDSKFKINSYGALLDVYVQHFGQLEGEQLAAAESGPIDEAYVGGGS